MEGNKGSGYDLWWKMGLNNFVGEEKKGKRVQEEGDGCFDLDT